jgi:hypothetical protein
MAFSFSCWECSFVCRSRRSVVAFNMYCPYDLGTESCSCATVDCNGVLGVAVVLLLIAIVYREL